MYGKGACKINIPLFTPHHMSLTIFPAPSAAPTPLAVCASASDSPTQPNFSPGGRPLQNSSDSWHIQIRFKTL